jgi:hypothetical protein
MPGAVPTLQFFGTASLELIEKPGRTLVRFDRFFEELVPKLTEFWDKLTLF